MRQVCRTRLPYQPGHVPLPETAFHAVTPDLVSYLVLANTGHSFLFLFSVILDHTSDLAIAERSNLKLYHVGNRSQVKPGTLAYLQDLSRVSR